MARAPFGDRQTTGDVASTAEPQSRSTAAAIPLQCISVIPRSEGPSGRPRLRFHLPFGSNTHFVPFPAGPPPPPPRHVRAEIADPGQVQHLGGQFQRLPLKAADVAGPLDQVDAPGSPPPRAPARA